MALPTACGPGPWGVEGSPSQRPLAPPPTQPHLWQDTAGWRSLLPLSPGARWSHRLPSAVALVGGDVATLTPLAQSLVQGHWGGRSPPEPQPDIRGCKPCAQPQGESGPWCWLAPHKVAHREATRATQGPKGWEAGLPLRLCFPGLF